MRHHHFLGKLAVSLRILMGGILLLPWMAGGSLAQEPGDGEPQLSPATLLGGDAAWEIPATLLQDPRLEESLATWGRELAHRDSLQRELNNIHGRAQLIGLRIRNLARDPDTKEPKDRGQHENLLSQGEKIREQEDRISVDLALSRERLRVATREVIGRLDGVIEDMDDPLPPDVVSFRERLLVWEEEIPVLPSIEVVIHPDDSPEMIREKAGYLRDVADGLENLANVLERRLENLRLQQRLLEGAEQVLDDAIFLDEGATFQDQGELPLRVRIEGRGDQPLAREGSVLLVTPEQSWDLGDLLEARPSSSRELEAIRTLLQGAVQEVAFQRDSVRAQATRFDEEATSREAP